MTVNSTGRRPNFFLIGAAKCGTTSVAQYLDQHPDIFVSKPKEPNFFAFEPNSKPTCNGPANSEQLYEQLLKYSVTSPTVYDELFAPVQTERAVGEASVRYLYETHTATRIAEYAPHAKLIAILRDPVDRLHSHYHMNVRQHLEPEGLAGSLAAEDERVQKGWGWDWHYRRVGMYAEQLERFYACFDRSQLLVLFHADLQKRTLETMQEIFKHLEVSTDFVPDVSRRALVGHTPRWRFVRKLIRDDNLLKTVAKQVVPQRLRKTFARWSESKNRQGIPSLGPKQRQELRDQYAEDSQQLADLLGQQLPW